MPRSVVDGQSLTSAVARAGADEPEPFAGNGLLGDTVITGSVSSSGVQNYGNLIVRDGATLAAIPTKKLHVRVSGNLLIEGTGKIHADGRGGPGSPGGKGGTGGSVPIEGLSNGRVLCDTDELPAITAGGGGGGGAAGASTDVLQGIGARGAYGCARQIAFKAVIGAGGSGGDTYDGLNQPGQIGSPGIAASALSVNARNQIIANFESSYQAARSLFAVYSGSTGAGGSGGGGSGGASTMVGGPIPGSRVGGNGGLANISEFGDGGNGSGTPATITVSPGAGGGASGSGGGWLLIEVLGNVLLSPDSRISANGGNGGDGGSAGVALVYGGGAGAGGGGAGGVVAVFFSGEATNLNDTTVIATGGRGGKGGIGSARGGNGGNGEAGYVILRQVG